MIKFILKLALWGGVLVGGSVLATNMMPSLKASVLEVVNPQVKEQRLVQQLQQSLNELVTAVPASGGTAAAIIAKNKAVAEKSQELLQQIAAISSPSDSLVSNVISGVVSKVADTVLGMPTPVSTSSPLPAVTTPVPCVSAH